MVVDWSGKPLRGDVRTEQPEDEAAHGFQAGGKEDRAENRLQRAGEDLGPVAAAGGFLALGERQPLANRKLAREAGERLRPDECRAQVGQLAFRKGRKAE